MSLQLEDDKSGFKKQPIESENCKERGTEIQEEGELPSLKERVVAVVEARIERRSK